MKPPVVASGARKVVARAALAGALCGAIGVASLACGACGHADRPPNEPTAGSGSAPGRAGTCNAVRARVEQLYRDEAKASEPSRVDEAVADNTAMVMNDCAQAPDKVAACIAAVTTVKDLEARCLAPIDDEGTEGDKLAR
jgi:NAD(P)H-dependent flavin oxidoreductase YrpB (nitropropane dioxygenase family)